MIRGTTPTLKYNLPFEVSSIDKLWIVFSQNEEERLFLDKSRCSLSGNTITVKLTQEETLSLLPNCIVNIQIRLLTNDGCALASKVMMGTVCDVSKGGVI